MLKIRLRRIGKKHQPHYKIVVIEHTAPAQGMYKIALGHYNPRTKEIVLNKEEAMKWMNNGAKPSNTVSKLFTKEGLKHKSIEIKTFRAKSKKELEKEAKEKEVEKAKEQAEKEASKVEFEKEVAEEKQEAAEEKESAQGGSAESGEEKSDEKSDEPKKDTTEGRSGEEEKGSEDKKENTK